MNINNNNNDNNTKAKRFAIKAGLIGSLGGLLFGFDLGVIAGALPQLKDIFNLSSFQQELVVSLMLFGAIFGASIGGFVIDRIGRWYGIQFVCFIFILGGLIQSFANSINIIYFGRFIVGIGVAISAIADVSYLTEVSPLKWRGAIVSSNELMITIGILIAYFIDYLLKNNKENGWRYMFGIGIIFAIMQSIGMVFMPRSPRWLLLKNKDIEAYKSLQCIYNTRIEIEDELERIKNLINLNKDIRKLSIEVDIETISPLQTHIKNLINLNKDIRKLSIEVDIETISPLQTHIPFKTNNNTTITNENDINDKKIDDNDNKINDIDDQFDEIDLNINNNNNNSINNNNNDSINNNNDNIDDINKMDDLLTRWKPQLLIAIILMLFQQFSGQANILNYAPEIFEEAGMSNDNSIAALIILGFVKVIMTLLALLQTDNMGRRYLLLCGIIVMIFSLILLILAFSIDNSAPLLSLLGCCLFVGAYAASYGPMAWLICSEMFPVSLRGRAIGIATVFNWFGNLIVSLTFLSVMNSIGPVLTFLIYLIISIFAFLFVYIYIPETKGLEAEEIIIKKWNNQSFGRIEHGTIISSIKTKFYGTNGKYMKQINRENDGIEIN